MTTADLLAMTADPEADAVVESAFGDPKAPGIFADIWLTLETADAQLALLCDALGLTTPSVLVAANDPTDGAWAGWAREGGQADG